MTRLQGSKCARKLGWLMISASWLLLSACTPASIAGASETAGERAIVLRPHAVVDVVAGRRLEGKVVIVRGERIESIAEAAAPLPEGAEVIDLPATTLLPGLIAPG